MKEPLQKEKLSREAIAAIEVGNTEIGRKLSVWLTLGFLCFIFAVPLSQTVIDEVADTTVQLWQPPPKVTGTEPGVFTRINRLNKFILQNINSFETQLEDGSFLRSLFLPPLQLFFAEMLGQGNEKVVIGRDGWLFYRPGVDYLIGQPFLEEEQLALRREGHEIWENPVQPDPLVAIGEFRQQLAERGIELLILPVPIKPTLHPEKLSHRSLYSGVTNRSLSNLMQEFERLGVRYFDPRPVLQEYSNIHGMAYLKTDTHWLAGAMESVAEQLSQYIIEQGLLERGDFKLQTQKVLHQGIGDIARMMTLPDPAEIASRQEISVTQILTEDNEFWQPSKDSELLLLGDSFTNIFSVDGLGWGNGAGFAEQLSYYLQQPVDLLARNDSGAYVTRQMLSLELSRGRDRLAGKKLVIWQFAERELALGDWKRIDLQLEEASDSGFYVVEPGNSVKVTGTIASISRSPRPGAVPYRDNIITFHLVDLSLELPADQALEKGQALVYGFGMRDNNLTPLASLRPDDRVTLTLSSWDSVEAEFGGYRRAPLDDDMMELELPNWGVLQGKINDEAQ